MRKFLILLFLTFLSLGCSSRKNGPDYVFDSKKKKELYIQSYNNTLKSWAIPFEEKDIKTSYGIAHVIITGPKTGEPLVLLHGTDASSTMWLPNIEAFSKDYRVYAIDFPLETGKSVSYRIKLSNKQTGKFYHQIFQHFDMKNINLLGISRGGWMATYLSLQPENDVKKIVLLSPAQTFAGVENLGKVLTAINFKMFPGPKSMDKFFNAFSYYPEKINSVFKQQLLCAYKYGNSKPRLLYMTKFSKKELKSLKLPVLLLIGDHDIVNSEKILIKAKKYLPNVETDIITNAGHFMTSDQTEIINKKVIEFLNKNSN